MSMSYHMRVYALQRKSTAFNLISIYLVAQGSDRMLQFKKISLICNNWRSLHVKHTFIMMKLYDYFPRWRVELKWWRIVALRTFIGCRSVHGSGARRACLLPAACAAHPAFQPPGRLSWNQGWCLRRVSGRRAGRLPSPPRGGRWSSAQLMECALYWRKSHNRFQPKSAEPSL